ncbi:hypothetical protein WJ0W_007012 [Paenibacillus melissococcoides]|uniref:Uncharacterized protein n=1 Tax=Paenibacillus melissococcoides TaxID=2912268 RepID=A0ABM9GEB6_9BACL|nr:hypothetical protein [Paenibacillus melissococcoides]CAH8249828.1 hypothetical protein WJ0W_007012 [Paenibacillus melissococcoides]
MARKPVQKPSLVAVPPDPDRCFVLFLDRCPDGQISSGQPGEPSPPITKTTGGASRLVYQLG